MTVVECIKEYKLDRRRKWFAWGGIVCRHESFTEPCSGCDGGGCHECGYTGKGVSGHPVPAFSKDNEFVKTTDKSAID